ncbi:glycogen debranching protein GlgX [Actinocatenispora comari]|uniref:Glycogen operon protein GlgX homolog n=1 Tax=Actinocatenispora comari TaxID=2807577 RepID=A0A8J4ACS4_9ACTN|nr:glycogen debranching protein GlgX [Actinocatenispora comari]GIL28320.1 glycogen operon protein GlgX homolog [Actinocatenispora comari]
MELGATPMADGVRFAVCAAHADAVEVCLYDGTERSGGERRVRLTERIDDVWYGHVPGVGVGDRYGLRAYGPWQPHRGHWFNPAKLLVDPYARRLTGAPADHPALRSVGADGAPDEHDSAPYLPRGVVTAAPAQVWRPPLRPWTDTVLYELHVRGFTARLEQVPERLRGSYAGLAHPAAVSHLRRLGVTAVELLPVQHSATEPFLAQRGLTNYWGYNTLGYFAPDTRFAATADPVAEFRDMVAVLHDAGIEVILDVVYNHTAEGPPTGPTLSWRGLANRTYYRLEPGDPARYRDFTGCGNTLDVRQPATLRLVLDSLRYWVLALGVDGFRFDLASALLRGESGVAQYPGFLAAVAADPVLRKVRLIAEPWDLGAGGYRVGGFGPGWSEWNGRYRDAVRDFWRGRADSLAELGTRLAGSEDLYGEGGRGPGASVNFVTAHDGFTLRDVVSYAHKHNEANGEGGADGTDDNRSENNGVEGDTDDPAVLARRRRQVRNLLGTLLLSAGVPMLLAGDELGRTQRGNNNAYCQDNEVSHVDWAGADPELLAFTTRLLELRATEPVFRRRHFFTGAAVDGRRDLVWYRADGAEVTAADWHAGGAGTLGAFLDGARADTGDPAASTAGPASAGAGGSYLLYLHGAEVDASVRLPRAAARWQVVLDTAEGSAGEYAAGERITMTARSLLVLRAVDVAATG